MHALFIFAAFQCVHQAWFQSCMPTQTDYLCKEIPKDYPAGLTSVIIFVNGLGNINLSMFNSTNLTSVNILTMALQDVTAIGPQTFEKFQNLKTLNLHGNFLSQVSSDWFSHHDSLETLVLSKNQITTLDLNSFDGLSNLRVLNLSQNQIHTITQSSFLSLSKLRRLDLSNNKLTYLSPDLFLPLNGTMIRLDGNPWNCSCSVRNFVKYLKGLQNASLLENEMLVCCNSPPALKGLPVWQVPECETLITTGPTTTSHPNAGLTTGSAATVIITKPLTIGHSTLIILIVVLCALVLVICVLSVLYHRKQERKHLQAVKPSSERSEITEASETTVKSNGKENRKVKSEIDTREFLLGTNKMVVGDEKISQIYHIYSSRTYETREPIKRVSSAGPVLCRTEMFAKQTQAGAATEEVGVRNDEYYSGWMTSEKDNMNRNTEQVEKLKVGKNTADEENGGFTDEFGNTTDTLESHMESFQEENKDSDKSVKAGISVDKDVLQNGVDIDVLEDLNELTVGPFHSQDIFQVGAGSSRDILQVGAESSRDILQVGAESSRDILQVGAESSRDILQVGAESSRDILQVGAESSRDILQVGAESSRDILQVGAESSRDVLQVKHVISQSEETAEKLPYLTIGADPENQTSVVNQNTAKDRSAPLRPIRRVLTWPPTAVQWKKQWAQNQQILNVFPKLIFVNGCRHEIRQFHPRISPGTLPTAPQFDALEFLPEITAPMEDVRIAIDEDTYRTSLASSTQKVQHFTAQEHFTNANISLREDGRFYTSEETWRSGLESTISDTSSKSSPIEESEVCSELFSIFNPSGGSKSKPAVGEEINNKDYMEKMQGVKKKAHRGHQSEQVASELQKQSRRAEKAAPRANRDQRRDQACNGSNSRAPPSGGSPKDDSLLLGNEYTFIDLLHEVVENHGRWTRDRWRQTQKNKHKLKESR
ncbi:uncharacterized protein [Pseudorasbora parva]|uniref:uncharacterized protein isoform X2 n=1 Tax=Pseudorasbora parva TaxID=51549 RepID=UPI00351F2175